MSEDRPLPQDPSQIAPTVAAMHPLSPAGARRPGSGDPRASTPGGWPDGLPSDLPARFGRYELLKLLGKGGMGAVLLALDTQLNRLVALKVPHFSGPDHFQLRDRFLREARVAATLAHPNLCPVYDCGEVNGVLYLTMAYLEGKPLARFIRPGQPLPPRAVVTVVRQLALAMQEAHERGVIHRDLKPSNIMITPKKQPVIMDFGLARRTDADDQQLTRSGVLMGTPAYMPPEQLNSDARAMGPATDVYALGVILYELLAGRPPFQGPLGELMARIMTEPPPPMTRWRPDLDPALDALCTPALAKKPADRYPSMAAFAGALEDYLRGRYRVPEPEPETYAVEPAEDTKLDEQDPAALFNAMAARQARQARARRRRRRFRLPEWLIPLVAASVTLVVMGGVLHYFYEVLERRSQRQEGAPATAPLEPARVAEEHQRRQESQALAEALARWRASPGDTAVRGQLDAWLDSAAGRREGLPPEVNLGLGQYLLLERNRWDLGLRRLALSPEGPWRQAADADLDAATREEPQAWLECGDRWWRLQEQGESLTVTARQHLRERAGLWYLKAQPLLSDADRRRVQRRLERVLAPK